MANKSNNANDISVSNLKKIILHGENTQEILLPIDEGLQTLELVFNDFSVMLNNNLECNLVTRSGEVFKGYFRDIVEEPSELTNYVNDVLKLFDLEGTEDSETQPVPVLVISIRIGQHRIQTAQS